MTKDLLIIKSSKPLSGEQRERFETSLRYATNRLSVDFVLVDDGLDVVGYERNLQPLVDAIQAQAIATVELVQATQQVVALNQDILAALVDDGADEEEEGSGYLDGEDS